MLRSGAAYGVRVVKEAVVPYEVQVSCKLLLVLVVMRPNPFLYRREVHRMLHIY